MATGGVPFTPDVIAARQAMQDRLNTVSVGGELLACVAGRDWHCSCGVPIRRGELHVRVANATVRMHEDCGTALWEAFVAHGPRSRVELVDLDAIGGVS